MTRFKQKIFVAPALAALGGKVMTGLNVAGNTAMIGGIFQGASQMKQAEEQAAQAEEQNRKMTKALNKIAENAKNNPQVAQQTADVMGQKQFARINLGNVFNRQTLQKARGLAKDIGSIALENKNHLIGGTLMGGAMAASSYATDKYIQHDIKKNNIPFEKTYAISGGSIMSGIKKAGAVVGNAAKENKKTIAVMSILGSAPSLIGYSAEKKQYKDQLNNTQQAASQRNYAIPGKGGILSKIKNLPIMKTPGQTILGGMSNISGGGGRKGVYNFGKTLESRGRVSGSEWSQKVGRFIMNNPKTALAGSIPVGTTILGVTWGAGESAINKAARAVDKNAFKYQDSKNEEIQ